MVESRQQEIEALRARLSAVEAARHDEAEAADGRMRDIQVYLLHSSNCTLTIPPAG